MFWPQEAAKLQREAEAKKANEEFLGSAIPPGSDGGGGKCKVQYNHMVQSTTR